MRRRWSDKPVYTCRDCDEPLAWALLNEKRLPFDVHPVERPWEDRHAGVPLYRFEDGVAYQTTFADSNRDVYTCHLDTCTFRERDRGRR